MTLDTEFLQQFTPRAPRRLTHDEFDTIKDNFITYIDGIPVFKVSNLAPSQEYERISTLLDGIFASDYEDKTGWAKERSEIDPLNAISTAHYDSYSLHHNREMNWLNEQVEQYAYVYWRFLGMTEDWELEMQDCWSNRHLEGGVTGLHLHPQRHISAAYYMSVPENGGDFYFRSFHEQTWFAWPNELGWDEGYDEWKQDRKLLTGLTYNYPMNVKTGDLMFWPSFMRHETGLNKSTDPRVVISYNMRARNKSVYRVNFA